MTFDDPRRFLGGFEMRFLAVEGRECWGCTGMHGDAQGCMGMHRDAV